MDHPGLMFWNRVDPTGCKHLVHVDVDPGCKQTPSLQRCPAVKGGTWSLHSFPLCECCNIGPELLCFGLSFAFWNLKKPFQSYSPSFVLEQAAKQDGVAIYPSMLGVPLELR